MNNKKRDKFVDELLVFMKKEIEKTGCLVDGLRFDFKFAENGYYVSGEGYQEPDGIHLQSFKKGTKIQNEEFTIVLNYCNTHKYITGRQEGSILTDKGIARANSIENAPVFWKRIFKSFSSNAALVISNIISTAVGGAIGAYITYLILGGKNG